MQPPNARAPTPSAAVAASQAFLRDRASNTSLSSAAAAAALRSQTASPISVASVQTKRMTRRGSVSSISSLADSGARPTLNRHGSSGSMSERTFRPMSPMRSSPLPTLHDDIPPLPQLPASVDALPTKRTRRSTSMDFSQPRVSSPAPRRLGGRGASLDRAARNLAKRASGAALAAEPPRPSLDIDVSPQRSVNFSYPISPVNSPPASPLPRESDEPLEGSEPETSLPKLTTPKQTDMSKGDSQRSASNRRSNSRDAPLVQAQGKRKTNEQAKNGRRPKGSTGRERPLGAAAAAAVVASRSNNHDSSATRDVETDRDRQTLTGSPPPMLWRKPSVVEEVDEEAESAPQAIAQKTRPKSVASVRSLPAKESKIARPTSATASMIRNSNKSNPVAKGPTMRNNRTMRPQSLSPARSAHFSNVTMLTTDGVKHEPPPRSVSPAKSVLKHSPSSSLTNYSPSASHIANRGATADTSDTLSNDGRDNGVKTKKIVRISFNADAAKPSEETNGTALPSSPHPLGMQIPMSQREQDSDVDLDDILKPSPELPSFGSVRDMRVLENGSDTAAKSVETGSPSISDSMSTLVEPMGMSNDQLVGAVFLQNQMAKNKIFQDTTHNANLQRIHPEVTKVEGSGSVSDSPSSDNSMKKSRTDDQAITLNSATNGAKPKIATQANSQTSSDSQHMEVPTIALQEATPTAVNETNRMSATQGVFTTKATEAIKHAKEQSEIGSRDSTPTPTLSNPRTIEPRNTAQSPESDDSGNETTSIYSDAAEDVYDHQDATFGSLDAMVEKAVPSSESAKEKKNFRSAYKTSESQDEDLTSAVKSQENNQQFLDNRPEEKSTHVHHIHWGSDQSIPQLKTSERHNMQKRGSISSAGTTEPKKPALKSALKNSDKTRSSYVEATASTANSRQDKGKYSSMRPSSPQFSEASFRPGKPKLLRGFSSDSDSDASESSFKRSRVSSSFADGKYAMRRSMRAPSPAFSDRPASVASTGRYKMAGLRPQSPERPSTAQSMRTTLRGPRETGPSLRKQTATPMRASGFAKAQKPKSKSSRDAFRSRFADSSDEEDTKQSGAIHSRFNDSDEEFDAQPRLAPVRSIPRQADIPEGDSTDLPDTEDDDTVPPMRNMPSRNAKVHTIPPFTNGMATKQTQGAVLASRSLRSNASQVSLQRQGNQSGKVNGVIPQTKQRRHHSLSSTFGFHKSANHASPNNAATSGITTPPVQSPTLPGSPSTTLSTVSTSRLRLHKLGFFHRRKQSSSAAAAAAAAVPPVPSAAWPLPNNSNFGMSKSQQQHHQSRPPPLSMTSFSTTVSGAGGRVAPERPQTSDGVASITSPASHARMGGTMRAGSTRPQMGRRTSTAMTAVSTQGTIVSVRTGKKKKFPKLRRAFGLVD